MALIYIFNLSPQNVFALGVLMESAAQHSQVKLSTTLANSLPMIIADETLDVRFAECNGRLAYASISFGCRNDNQ